MTVDEIVDQYSVHQPKGQARGTIARRSLKKKLNQLIQERERLARGDEIYRLKKITFDKNTWPSALTNYLNGRLTQLRNKTNE